MSAGPVWHREQGMIEHAHATEQERQECSLEAAMEAAWRTEALANYFSTTDREEVTA